MNKLNKDMWTTIIKPRSGWFDINVKELWQYRDLIILFVRRDFIANYKQTILGPLWFLLQPLLTTLVFTLVFGRIAKIPTDGIPPFLFYLSGITIWNYFSSCLYKTSDTFIANAGMFGKVYFPRLAVPVSVVITNLFTFLIQFTLLIVFIFYYYAKGAIIKPNLLIFITPLILIQMAALGLGVGIIISSLTTKYRDLAFVVSFGVQLWMYATPVVYPMSQIPAKYQSLYSLNPMASIVETFRYAFLGTGNLQHMQLLISVLITCILLVFGIILFSRVEKTFMDTV